MDIIKKIKDNKYELAILIIFILAVGLRLNLNGLPLDHPGNIKAADPFYHTIITDIISDTQQWKYYPDYIHFGESKLINQQPPLMYLDSSIISQLSTLPSWTSIFFIVALFGGLRVILLYLLTLEIFENKNIALIAAALYVIPFPPSVWLYEIYIGFWIQIFSLTFLIAFAWLYIKYLKERKNWQLGGIAICITSIMLSHPQELLFLFLPTIYLFYSLIKEKIELKEKIKKIMFAFLYPLLNFIFLLPWFLYVWKGSSYRPSWNFNPFPADYLSGITTPRINFFPWWYLVIALIGLILIVYFWKKYKTYLILLGYYTFLIVIIPFSLKSPYYLGRVKVLWPILLAPAIAFFIYVLFSNISKLTTPKLNSFLIYIAISILIIVLSISSIMQLQQQLKGELIDQDKWEAFTWIQDNIPEDKEILFLEDCSQASCIYTKRKAASVEMQDFVIIVEQLQKNNSLPKEIKYFYAADTLWDYPSKEISPFYFQPINKNHIMYSQKNEIKDFEFIYLRDLNKDYTIINIIIIEKLQELNFQIVYTKNGITILKKNE